MCTVEILSQLNADDLGLVYVANPGAFIICLKIMSKLWGDTG